jgi:hypothetical protein
MKSHIANRGIKNANAYFITDGECGGEELRPTCQELHNYFIANNVSLKVSTLGIGDSA